MFGWSRLTRADGEESDVNLLSADELSSPTSSPNNGEPSDSVSARLDSVVAPTDEHPEAPTLDMPWVEARDSNSSNNRSRHRSRRHRHHSRHRLCRFKRRESNFLTAITCMFVVVLVCTSLAEPHWFYFIGGKCMDYAGQPINYVGVKLFFYQGYFRLTHSSTSPMSVYYYGSASNEVLINCVTSSVVFSMRIITALCFLVIFFSLIAFILHLLGSSHRVLRALRSNAIFSIVSVVLCIVINGLSYLVLEQLNNYYQANLFHQGSRVDVEFSLGFYMITAAGAMSIIGVACNLLRPSTSRSRREHRDQMSYRLPPSDPPHPSICSQLAPPPYSP